MRPRMCFGDLRAAGAGGLSRVLWLLANAGRSPAEVTGPVSLAPPHITGSLTVGQTLTCSTGDWLTTGSVSYAYQWQRGGVNIASATASTRVTTGADIDTALTCKVTATDDVGAASASGGPVLITGQPSNTVAPAATGTATVGSTLSSTTGTWTGSAPITYGYQWRRDGVAISLATASTYVVVGGDAGKNIDCLITATNSYGVVSADSNDILIVTTPVCTVDPVITGDTAPGSTLTTNGGTFTGGSIVKTYKWYADGVEIGGATATTYVTLEGDADKDITNKTTGTNAAGSVTSNASNVITVESPAAPVNTVEPAITGLSAVGSTLTCSTGTWDGSPTSYSYQWTRAGVDIGGATANTRVTTQDDAGTEVGCRVRATNAGGTSDPVTATGAVVVTPAVPSFSSAASADTSQWNDVAHNGLATGSGSMFVAIADDGGTSHVMTSPDGVTWTARTAGSTATYMGICCGTGTRAGVWIAVALSSGTPAGRIMKSTDNGVTWAMKTTPNTNSLTSVCYSEDLDMFVAVCGTGTNNRVTYSTDGGETWSAGSSIPQADWECVRWGNGVFIACASSTASANQIMTSPDGTTWTGKDASAAVPWKGVAHGVIGGQSTWVCVGNAGTSSNESMTSTDNGETWTTHSVPNDQSWNAVDFAYGKFVAVSGSGSTQRAMYTTDATSWTAVTTPNIAGWQAITHGAGILVAVTNGGNANGVMTSL